MLKGAWDDVIFYMVLNLLAISQPFYLHSIKFYAWNLSKDDGKIQLNGGYKKMYTPIK